MNAALSCFKEQIVLIAGGYDKWEDYDWLSEQLKNKIWFCCLIWQTAKKFSKIFDKQNIEYKIFDDFNTAVNYSVEIANKLKLNNILFSPWAASFDMFKNVYDRCEQFSEIIDKI
jgi:UDP-N-acetylmuramoylalanine--D-glutamate ligase